MAIMFGRFEILGELSKSDNGAVYKATDTESNQTVALKTLRLDTLGEHAAPFVEKLLAESESTRDLSCQNIALLYGAGEADGQFCAAMEYVQGNSVATIMARKEGFSIWDLLDITRQVSAALDHAASMGVAHSSLEPAKIMVQWDGLVKILGYGISSMSLIGAATGSGLGALLPYCSPEMVKGEAIDLRSNLFTWGAILYQMVTDRRAFDAEERAALENQIVNEVPPSPVSLNPRIHPGVSALIMKALAKDPAERFQSARELAAELEKCKEGGARSAAAAVKKPASANPAVSPEARAAAARKFLSSVAPSGPTPAALAPRAIPEPRAEAAQETKAAAAAAGAGIRPGPYGFESNSPAADTLVETFSDAPTSPVLSAAVAEPETATQMSGMTVDPIMAAPVSEAAAGPSFSDIDELPPLKAPVFATPSMPEPTPEVPEPRLPLAQLHRKEEKPKVQAREVAQKALNEIKTVPSRLIFYAILCAVALILVVVVALFFHVRSQDDDLTAASRPTPATTQEQPTAPEAPPPVQQAAQQTAPAPDEEAQPEVTVRQFGKHSGNSGRKKAPASAPAAAVPGQAQIDSNPQGAQIQIDGKSDPSWITPFDVTGLSPGQHTVTVSKSGYSAESRSVEVASSGKSFVVLHLSPINALMAVNSTPSGAEVILDGRTTGKVTPAQFAVEKGNHTVLLRKQGYLEETTSADLGPGQNFQFAPALRPLGNADDIKTVGKFKKFFGGKGGEDAAGMGTLSIHTQPKGAQIALNRRLLDRLSPVEFMLGPGNYVVDITATGFKPVHRIITVEKGGKVAIDETLERE